MDIKSQPENKEEQIKKLEAILFTASTPVKTYLLSKSLNTTKGKVKELITILKRRLEKRNSALTITERAGGYKLCTRPKYGKFVAKVLYTKKPVDLTPASLETLSLIAYKQPISRIDIAKIRGVSPDSSLSTLLEYDLIEKMLHDDNQVYYKTTEKFLEITGLNNIKELPELEGEDK